MSHLPFTLLAYFLNALAVLSNKFLLQKTITEPLIYVFYISLVSLFAILALPFTRIPTFEVWSLASLSAVLWTFGAYFMFKALKLGQVSRVIPIIGTLIPLILLMFAFQTHTISNTQILAVWLLVIGMIFLTITDWRARLPDGQGNFSKREIVFEILSAGLFAVSYILLKQAYLKMDFFSVIVWSRLILLPLGIFILLIPDLRKKIVTSSSSLSSSPDKSITFLSKAGLIFIGGQVSGAISELLLLFAISLANPALVNSLQGTQYIFLLFFSLILAKKYPAIFEESYTHKIMLSKLAGIILIGIGLYFMAIV